jgi:hypothetical protein
MPLRRLTQDELKNSYDDLFGAGAVTLDDLPEDTQGSYGFATSPKLSPVEVSKLGTAAEKAVGRAFATAVSLPEVPACDVKAAGEAACAREILGAFGLRTFRRPLADSELGAYTGLLTTLRTGPAALEYKDALGGALEALLQSPPFLYHWELGPAAAKRDGVLVRLTPYEVASRLSFLLWSGPPDRALLDKARAGGLATPAELEVEARRLLKDRRFERSLASFHRQWLHLDGLEEVSKDGKLFPTFTAALAKDMASETELFTRRVLADDGRLEALLTAGYSFVNAGLAKIYGAPATTGAELRRTELPRRTGVFTLTGFLSRHSSSGGTAPVKRGEVVLKSLLCRTVPPPPPDVNNAPPPPDLKKQTREQFEQHSRDPICSACHKQMDALGFAFEIYDPIGADRPSERGRPVDATGELPLDDRPSRFDGAPDLLRKIAASADARACYTRQWARYLFGRGEVTDEAQALHEAMQLFATKGGDVRELLVALVKTRAFSCRTPSPGEVLP